MKIKLHIPTEEYGFVEIESNVNPEANKSIEEVIEDSLEFYNTSKNLKTAPTEGLDSKAFNQAVNEYLSTGTLKNGTNLYEAMSPPQREWFQITKRAFARLAPQKEDRVRLELNK